MPHIIDDKSEHCVPFIAERLRLHRAEYEEKLERPPPFFLGLNGVQGAGKTTLVGCVHRPSRDCGTHHCTFSVDCSIVEDGGHELCLSRSSDTASTTTSSIVAPAVH